MKRQVMRQLPLVVAIGSLLAGGVQAATITVTTTADAPLGTISDECTLRAAIAAANSGTEVDGCVSGSSGSDEIVFDEGLAHAMITLSEGQLQISSGLAITGPVPGDAGGMTINGDQQSRIFRAVGPAAEPSEFGFRLDGITLTGGRTTGNAPENGGGAVYARFVDVTLEHTVVTGNSTNGIQADSGGLAVRSGNLTLTRSTVSANRTDGPSSPGGGLLVVGGNTVLSYSTVSGNSTTQGSGRGGGLYAVSSNVTIMNSTVSGNSTAGGVSQGGGLHLSNGDATLINSTVSGNSTNGSSSNGGGILLANVNATFTHTTVAHNTAADGTHGIHKGPDSSLALNNSLIVQISESGVACNVEADSYTNSLVTDASCTGQVTDFEDIALSPLADNGGPTLTHGLGAGSLARTGAGDCETEFGIDLDQRGQPRPAIASSACDIGAVEFIAVGFPETLDFGTRRVGTTSDPLTMTLSNLGNESLSITSAGPVAGPGADAFAVVDDQCSSTTLASGESCSLDVEFTPDARANFETEFEFAFSVGADTLAVSLGGSGIAPVMTLQPQLVDFGSVVLGLTGGPLMIYIGNDGDDALAVNALFGLAAPFSLASGGSCQSLPFTLSPGEQCGLELAFTPGTAGATKQAVFVPSDSFGGDQAFMLQGSGASMDIFADRFEQ
jgi:CSLREA domain-containing protein